MTLSRVMCHAPALDELLYFPSLITLRRILHLTHDSVYGRLCPGSAGPGILSNAAFHFLLRASLLFRTLCNSATACMHLFLPLLLPKFSPASFLFFSPPSVYGRVGEDTRARPCPSRPRRSQERQQVLHPPPNRFPVSYE